MTLCSDCAEKHRAEIEFAAVIIDAEIAGRRTSKAATDLRAMLPPRPDSSGAMHEPVTDAAGDE